MAPKCYKLLIAFLALCLQGIAQDTTYIETDTIKNLKFLRTSEVAFVDKDFDLSKGIANVSFEPLAKHRSNIDPKNISKKILVRFKLKNSSDSVAGFYFFPGFFFNNVRMYVVNDNSIGAIPSIAPQLKDSVSFRLINIPSRSQQVFLAEVDQVKTYNNRILPRIIEPDHVKSYISEVHNENQEEILITYIFCGLLIMMVLFSIANYFQGGNKEFLLYTFYAIFIGVMLFTKSYYDHRSYYKTFFFEAYLDFILQCLAICFYMAFMSKFLHTKANYPFLYKLYKYGIAFLIVAMVVYTYLHYGTEAFFVENLVENYITKGLLIIMIIVFLVYAAKRRHEKLLRYLFWGNLLYFILSTISLTLILDPGLRASLPDPVFNSALFYYETGLFIELVFFLAGLAYKNRKQIIEQTKERERLTIENERKELEKQMAVMAAHQEERNRISADMHDELGSGMTTIRLMSEIARSKMKEEVPIEIEKISHSANDLLNKMNAIIWSMNSGNDSVDNLVSYIRTYAFEYLEGTSVHCVVNIPDHIHHQDLSGDKRRNIFLCVKETLNNVLKHSKASEIKIDIDVNDHLKIRIADNGKGIDLNHIRQFGNGLKNIRRRMESIGGSFDIRNENGTITTLSLPL